MNSKHIPRQLKCFAVLILLTLFLLVFHSEHFPDLYFINLEPREDVSCHYKTDNDALPSIDERFNPSTNSIFFHETSCHGRLDSRQACSIESAARTHPDWEIHVLFSALVNKLSLGDINIELLRLMKNVYFSRVHIVDYAKGTPLEDLVSGGALNRTRWPISHTSDVLRYLTLYKYGGVYLDLDVVVLKPLLGLPGNWVARENNYVVNSAAMSFSRDSVGMVFADAAVRLLAKSFRGDVWGQNGPVVITNVLKQICSTNDLSEMSTDKCLGFEVYPPALFYPMNPDLSEAFLEPGDFTPEPGAYVYHLWNKRTHDLKVHKDSPYAKLAKRFCPIVYETYRDRFGL